MINQISHAAFAVNDAKRGLVRCVTAAALVCAGLSSLGVEVAGAQSKIDEAVDANGVAPKLELTAAQKSAIYQAVRRDKNKVAPNRFATNRGAQVPPMIELYMLPDDILASNPETKLLQFTRVDNQVVLVDPTHMRVIDVIGPAPGESD